jgi:hypothetical protein
VSGRLHDVARRRYPLQAQARTFPPPSSALTLHPVHPGTAVSYRLRVPKPSRRSPLPIPRPKPSLDPPTLPLRSPPHCPLQHPSGTTTTLSPLTTLSPVSERLRGADHGKSPASRPTPDALDPRSDHCFTAYLNTHLAPPPSPHRCAYPGVLYGTAD